jgi:hypothetical protein
MMGPASARDQNEGVYIIQNIFVAGKDDVCFGLFFAASKAASIRAFRQP